MRRHKPEPVVLDQLAKEIVVVSAARQMEEDYTTYAAYVNLGRALPDVRDGLKTVQRRVLFALHELGLTHDAKFKKCARIDGDVTGKYSPHGSAYSVLVNMANDWANRYAFVDGQGNFGSTEDGPAAARYTEARQHKFAELVLTTQLDSNWIDFKPNYDESTTEPTVLPARLPALLLRDTSGIGVAVACRHVSYLLSEVAELAKAALKGRLTPDDGLKYVTAPDFAMGGDLLYDESIQSVIRDGCGTLRLYAKFRVEGNLLVCYELPQDVSGEAVLNQTFGLIKSEHISRKLLLDARNETDRSGTRVVWELRSESDIPMLQQLLFDKTDCRITVSVNAVSVDADGLSYSLKGVAEVANSWAKFRRSYETKRLAFELDKLQKRSMILAGLLTALDNIVLIAKSLIEDVSIATLGLDLNAEQIDAIESMPLRTLKAKSRLKLQAEIDEAAKQMTWRANVLASDASMTKHLCKDVAAMAAEFSDTRRTSKLNTFVLESVAKAASELKIKALAEKHNGYLVDLAQEGKEHEFYLRSSRSKKLVYKDCCPGTDVGIACLLSNGSLYFIPVSALTLDGSNTINVVLAAQKYTGKSMTGVHCCWSKAVNRADNSELSLMLVAAGSHYGGKKSVARSVSLVLLAQLQGRVKSFWIDVCSAKVTEVQPKTKFVTVTQEPDTITKLKIEDLNKVTQLGKATVLSLV